MRLSYSLSMWNYEAYAKPDSLGEAIADARRSGYGVEVWPSWKQETDLFAPENRDRLVRLLREARSSLHGGSAVRTLEAHCTQIDAAKDTKSPVLVLHADSLGLEQSGGDFGLARDAVAYAAQSNVIVALENGVTSIGLDGVARSLESVEGLRACLDIGHVYAAGDYPLREYLRSLGGRIAHLHLQDVYLVPGTKRAKNDSHRTPGQCDIPFTDWQLLLSTLDRIDYKGAAVFEIRPFDPVEIAAQAGEFLDSISR